MRIMKLALAALFAVLAFSAMAASSASAAHPIFLTANHSAELLVLASYHKLSLLRGEKLGALGLVGCKLVLFHGWVLNNSTLIHRIKILFENDCLLSIPATGTHKKCTEPIHIKILLGELGLLSSTNHKVVILLAPSDGTGEFVKIECEGEKITVSGTVVGEIPELNAKGENQLNSQRAEIETRFEVINGSTQQAIQEIFLLGTQMTGQSLEVSELFGGKASEEVAETNIHGVNSATTTEISTK